MRTLAFALFVVVYAAPLHAQFIEDPTMMIKGQLFAGDMYSYDSWDQYWEGTLKRVNGNVGTVSRRTNLWFVNYGLTDRLNLIGTMPYVWTRASQGVLMGQRGFQDLTLAAKFRLVDAPSTSFGRLRAIFVGGGSFPLTDYTPDFLPLSIGTQSKRWMARLTVDAQSASSWYVSGTTSYTARGRVTLDRPYYFTEGQLVFSDKVRMPEVFDYTASVGSRTRVMDAAFFVTQQQTLGGGDIRRQDAAFVSNRMNYVHMGGRAMAAIPKVPGVIGTFSYSYTVGGRNVGQSSTIGAGLFYNVPLLGRP